MKTLPIVLACLVAAQPGAAKERPPALSWGRPGVTFDQYRADAVACATIGYLRDVSGDEPAKRFLRGFRSADDALNNPGGMDDREWINAIRRTQPDRRRRELHQIQVGDVERCLTDRGYRSFALSAEERRTLARYPAGSDGRHRYLHRLASRPWPG